MLKRIAISTALVILAGLPASAGELFPRLALVSGVPAGDRLNVRQMATGSSADIGDLENGALVEVIAQKGNWGQILWGEANGWISLKFTKPAPRPVLASGLPVGLQCGGTEPFWDLKLLKLGIAYMDGASVPIFNSGVSKNSRASYFFTTGEGNAILRREECSDGMSDRTYGWQLDIVTERGLFSGCCTINQ